MDDLGILDKKITIQLGGKDYPITFTLASIYYLADKFGDVGELFTKMKIGGLDSVSLDIVSNLIYAGMLVCDEDDNLKAPLKPKKIMTLINLSDIAEITNSVIMAFSSAFPDAKKNPTIGESIPEAKTDGTGDTSIQPELSS